MTNQNNKYQPQNLNPNINQNSQIQSKNPYLLQKSTFIGKNQSELINPYKQQPSQCNFKNLYQSSLNERKDNPLGQILTEGMSQIQVQRKLNENQKQKERLDNLDKNDLRRHYDINNYKKLDQKSFSENFQNYCKDQRQYNQFNYEDIPQELKDKLNHEYIQEHKFLFMDHNKNKKLNQNQIEYLNKIRQNQGIQMIKNGKQIEPYQELSNEQLYLLDFKDRPDYKKNLILYEQAIKRNKQIQETQRLLKEKNQNRKLLGYNIIANHNILYKDKKMPQNPQIEPLIQVNKSQDGKILYEQVYFPSLTEHRKYYQQVYEQENQANQRFGKKQMLFNYGINNK
ncbi:hypothetical protein PPERSA_05099 [Pseudocohnilembus persalinus]|uniref:Uncharacterized protein n=1 Tax=Pseudocohnilembus persalinus TaxID=266149 RepID=A0A0V0QWA4_PSEPJ|nr:hypothetical protein PPERSA_05099 [Pseudocohnilembus persalinus]|eukprot:KRX06486.1 hypothetical protein PPERSA_05099 [Pseudocohnilembus persalinus]